MIDIRGLTKRFGTLTAVDGVTFQARPGEVLGFLGPNGAGKSTTMKMVTGFLTPTAGAVSVCGFNVADDPLAVKQRLGYLPEGAPAYPDMTPEGFLKFVAQVRGLTGDTRRTRMAHVVSAVHLEGVLRQPIDTLSKGYKRRVGLAAAILHDPEVLVMDEPTDGLDPNQKHEVRTLIRSMSANKTIVLSTHILEEVEAVCSRAIIISRGRIVADGTPAQLQAKSKYHNAVFVSVRGAEEGMVRAELGKIAGVENVEAQAGSGSNGVVRVAVLPTGGKAIVAEVGQAVRARGWQADELRVEVGRLDEVFRTVTSGAGGGA